jgi:hypothetical protein
VPVDIRSSVPVTSFCDRSTRYVWLLTSVRPNDPKMFGVIFGL